MRKPFKAMDNMKQLFRECKCSDKIINNYLREAMNADYFTIMAINKSYVDLLNNMYNKNFNWINTLD